MKIINIDVEDEIVLNTIEDVDTGEITGISSKITTPTGNFNNIILNFNFDNEKLCEDMNMFASFKIINGACIDVALEKIIAKDKECKYACYIPAEVFEDECDFLLGLYGYALNEDESLKQRVSFKTVKNSVVQGTYDPDAQESITPTPTTFELYLNKLLKELKSTEERLQNEINSSNSGTLVANSIDEMTDTTKIYVNKADGNWYYYDGSAWVIGGVYQANPLSVYEKDGIDLAYTTYKNGLDRDWVINTMILRKQKVNLDGYIGAEVENRLRTGRIATAERGCIVKVNNPKFLMSTRYYSDKTSTDWGSEFITYEDWTDKPVYVGKYPVYVLCFKKIDDSDFTDEDILELRQTLDVYSFTDTSLSKSGVPADAKVVGETLRNAGFKKPYESGMIHFNINVNSKILINEESDENVSDEVLGVLMLPTNYTPTGKKTPIICMCHGASGVITDTIWYNDNWLNLVQAYLDAGFVVFDTNRTNSNKNGYGKTYGSPISVEALYKAYQYIKENYNVEDKLFLHGTSMGGTTAQSFAYTYPNLVKACVCFAPANTLYSIWRGGTSIRNETDANLIANCFGYETREEAKTDGYKNLIGNVTALRIKRYNTSGNLIKTNIVDVLNSIENSANGGFWHNENEEWYLDFPVPIKIFMGTNDASVEQSFNECLVKAIRNSGGIAYLKLIENGTHTEVSYGLTDNTQNEAIMFFERFK